MSIPDEANGHAPEAPMSPKDTLKSERTPASTFSPKSGENMTVKPGDHPSPPQPQRKPKPKRPNYAQLHSKPLPLKTHPLPAFHPSHPISLLRLSYVFLTHLFSSPSSHPEKLYTGLFSPRTRSVHITDPDAVRALWEMGFFGKGTLSRSEPSWLQREGERLRREREGNAGGGKGGAAEVATQRRREERRLFKLERARVERERIERQRAVEEGRLGPEDGELREEEVGEANDDSVKERAVAELDEKPNDSVEHKALHEGRVPDADLLQTPAPTSTAQSMTQTQTTAATKSSSPINHATANESPESVDPSLDIPNQEHLQLTLEEAFFLTYGLGVLSVLPPPPSLNPAPFHPGPTPYSTTDLLFLSCHHSAFPPVDSGSGIAPDDQFLLNYVVYHHFRSLGWVVRPGIKFGVDYLLYNRGPVFSHAEFAVLIIPAYTHRYWNTPGGRSRRRVHYPGETSGFSTLEEDGGTNPTNPASGGDGKDWWFLHCVNRVQSQVRKTLVLCYVDVPSPWEVGLDDEWDVDVDVGRLLRGYRVREFVVRRWVVNRSRD